MMICKACDQGVMRHEEEGFTITRQEAYDAGHPELEGTKVERVELAARCVCCEGVFEDCSNCAQGKTIEASADVIARGFLKAFKQARPNDLFTHIMERDKNADT